MKRYLKNKDKPAPRGETQAALEARLGVSALMGANISGAGATLPAMVRTPHGWRILNKSGTPGGFAADTNTAPEALPSEATAEDPTKFSAPKGGKK